MNKGFYIALVHSPVNDKNGEEITSAVTNLDIHDLSRLAKTYGVDRFYIVTPDEKQQELISAITAHWRVGYGASYNGNRKEALGTLKVVDSINTMKNELSKENGREPVLVSTCAQKRKESISFDEMKEKLGDGFPDCVLLLGTAWGLSEKVFELSNYVLEPVDLRKGYNHLSVRSAASIILDRLLN